MTCYPAIPAIFEHKIAAKQAGLLSAFKQLCSDITIDIGSAITKSAKNDQQALTKFPDPTKRQVGKILAKKPFTQILETKTLAKQVANTLDSIFRLTIIDQDSDDHLNPSEINTELKTLVEALVVKDLTEVAMENTDEFDFDDAIPEYTDPDDDDESYEIGLEEGGYRDSDNKESPFGSLQATNNPNANTSNWGNYEDEPITSQPYVNDNESTNTHYIDDPAEDIRKESLKSLIKISNTSVPYLFSLLQAGIKNLNQVQATDDSVHMNGVLELLSNFDLEYDAKRVQLLKDLLTGAYSTFITDQDDPESDDEQREISYNNVISIIETLSAFKSIDHDEQTFHIIVDFLINPIDNEEVDYSTSLICLKTLSKFPENSYRVNQLFKKSLLINLTRDDNALSHYAAALLSSNTTATQSITKDDIDGLFKTIPYSEMNPGLIASILINIGRKNPALKNTIINNAWSGIHDDSSFINDYALVVQELSDDKEPLYYNLNTTNHSNIHQALIGDLDFLLDVLRSPAASHVNFSPYLFLHSYNTNTIERLQAFACDSRQSLDSRKAAIDVLQFIVHKKSNLLADSIEADEDSDSEFMFCQADKVSFKLLLGDAPSELTTQALDALIDILVNQSPADENYTQISSYAKDAIITLKELSKPRLEKIIIENNTDKMKTGLISHLLTVL